MSGLAGARIALLEARLASEMAELVRREDGDPLCAPAVYEAPVDISGSLASLIDDMRTEQIAVVVCLTGAGLASLFAQAEEMGVLPALVDALSTVLTICRGPKPAAVLRRHEVPVRGGVKAPHTTSELLDALADIPLRDRRVVVICDGGHNALLVDTLSERGAHVEELRTYEWQLPEDVAPLERLINSLTSGHVDAVAFTTQVQVRHLFAIADRLDQREPLRHALVHRTIVASIGPSCSTVLEEFGVTPHVVASPPRMRPLITAIGAYLAARAHPTEATTR